MGTPLCQVSPDRSASRSLRLGMQDALTALEPLKGRIARLTTSRGTAHPFDHGICGSTRAWAMPISRAARLGASPILKARKKP